MTAPNIEAVEAARTAALKSYNKNNPFLTHADHGDAMTAALISALPFLAPQPSQSDEDHEIAAYKTTVSVLYQTCERLIGEGAALREALEEALAAKPWLKNRIVSLLSISPPKNTGLGAAALAAGRAEATLAGAAAEREACAKVADEMPGYMQPRDVAAAIRARK